MKTVSEIYEMIKTAMTGAGYVESYSPLSLSSSGRPGSHMSYLVTLRGDALPQGMIGRPIPGEYHQTLTLTITVSILTNVNKMQNLKQNLYTHVEACVSAVMSAIGPGSGSSDLRGEVRSIQSPVYMESGDETWVRQDIIFGSQADVSVVS